MELSGWHKIADFIEINAPEMWRLCYPRVYRNVGGYHSPKRLAVDLAAILQNIQNAGLPSVSSGHMFGQLGIGATKLIELRVPIFFVARDLLAAIQETTPPVEVDWRTLQLPFHSAAFMLPVGGLQHETEGEVAFIWYSRWKKDESGTFPCTKAPIKTFTTGDDVLLVRLASSSAEYQQVYSGREDPILNLVDLSGLRRGDWMEGSFVMSASDNTLIAAAVSILFGILFVMQARPQLVERGLAIGKKTQHGVEFWSPNVIGRLYQITRQGPESGEVGVSPRMHWRRGHWRRQAYGPQHSLRRDQWIEPMLIAAEMRDKPVRGE